MNNWRFDIVVTAAVDPDHVLLDVDHESLDRSHRLLIAALDRQARISREVRKRNRHPQPPLRQRPVAEIRLHVPDHVLLDVDRTNNTLTAK